MFNDQGFFIGHLVIGASSFVLSVVAASGTRPAPAHEFRDEVGGLAARSCSTLVVRLSKNGGLFVCHWRPPSLALNLRMM